ncbi:hypothetical protein E2986_12095 [Frieseomelitta varia]|uniref:F-box domain-containing protein n=1 Tax=Frieseomelitta varia TaxID=561572 RepID=A0A833W1I3_9HYME|nr:hypothetical protein E2986_12095 [Frieseomelitta varia]
MKKLKKEKIENTKRRIEKQRKSARFLYARYKREINRSPQQQSPTSPSSSRQSWYDSVDSGYVSLTPQSGGYTPIISGYKSRVSCISSKRHHRIRLDPLQSDLRTQRHSTPQMITQVSPRRKTSSPVPPSHIVLSPNYINASPPISSTDTQKPSKYPITSLATITEIKPKRLDFSHCALSGALHYTRATPDYTGRETVDILSLLGDRSNHWRIVSKILSFLGPQDLCSVSMVSKTWRTICMNDSKANTRRLIHVILRKNVKENLKLIKKSKIEGDIQSSPKSRYARKGYLLEVQNLLQVPGNQLPPGSPPVSPSKVKFHSFVKSANSMRK